MAYLGLRPYGRALIEPRFSRRALMLAGSMAVLALAAGPGQAFAQGEAAEAAEVVVTGSRVIQQGFSSPSPVTAISANDLLATRPAAIVESLSQLPAFTSSTTRKSVGGSSSAGPGSFLNLRGLGATRNLVLLDGRRVTPTNIAGNVDVNMLPQALVASVAVVTGGASAAYGSDAVAGVTNFILDTKFTGFKADFSGGLTERGDGEFYKVSLAGGRDFLDGRLHVIASVDIFKARAAFASNRDWSNRYCAPIPVPGVTTANQSATNPRQVVACDVTLPYASYGGAIIAGPLTTANQGITFGPGGSVDPFVYGALRTTNFQIGGNGAHPADTVNFATPLDSKGFFTHADLKLTDHVSAFAQLAINGNGSRYPQTPAFFYQTRAFTIFRENAFLPTSVRDRMAAGTSFQLGIVPKSWGVLLPDSRYDGLDFVAGLKGDFGKTWTWDAYYEHGVSRFKLKILNQINLEHLYRAVDAVVNPANGQIVCQSSIANPSNGCVPINVFGPGAATPAQRAYIRGVLINSNRVQQDAGAASVRGEPISLWAGPVTVAFGAEWRRQEGTAYSDPISQGLMNFAGIRGFPTVLQPQFGGWLTNNPKPINGKSSVKEAFGEVLVPLLKDMALAKSLDLNAAVRVTDYSNSGTVETWKVGATWQPVEDIRLRATKSRDIRAPSINELFASTNEAPATVNDAFKGGASVNIKTLGSGNPNLTPERADTLTFGVVYQSSAIRGLGMSVDYYNIKIKDVLGTIGAQETIDRCFAGATELCPLLIRDATGTLANVRLPQLNLAGAKASGIDFEISYRKDVSEVVSSWKGQTTFRVIGSRLLERSTRTPTLTGVNVVDRAGDVGAGNPTWRVNVTASYENGPFTMNALVRYVGKGAFNNTFVVGDIADNTVPDNLTFDVAFRYRLQALPGQPEFYFNIDNIFDRDPPLIPGTALTSAQTNASLYDTFGRAFSGGVRLRW